MNERIRELAKQAKKHFPKTETSGEFWVTETSGEFWVLDEEKFAELVIQDFVSRLKSDTNAWVDSLNLTSQDEMNKIYTEQLARQLDEEWYWSIK